MGYEHVKKIKIKGLGRPTRTSELENRTCNCSSLAAWLKVQLSATQVVTKRNELVRPIDRVEPDDAPTYMAVSRKRPKWAPYIL